MAERKVHVFRLDVTYPPNSLEPGWEPEDWAPGIHHLRLRGAC